MLNFKLNNQEYKKRNWKPSDGVIGDFFGFDTETVKIKDNEIPLFIIGQAYPGGDTVFLIPLRHLKAFFELHQHCTWFIHNAPFDISVVEQEISVSFKAMVKNKQIIDTAILYRLWKLATEGQTNFQWGLQSAARELLKVTISKDDVIRTNFGKYRDGNTVHYKFISEEELDYAAIDAVVTFQIYAFLIKEIRSLKNVQNLLSHKIQLMGAIALAKVSRLGIGLDLSQRDALTLQLDQKIEEYRKLLAQHGYHPGNGSGGELQAILRKLELNLPLTPKGNALSSTTEDLQEYRRDYPFIDSYLHYNELKNLHGFLLKLDRPRIHTYFNTLLTTGRTSSSKPNVQNLPRAGGIREFFVPAPGYCFFIIDYSTLELCTLAQVCLDKYGHSKMAELINESKDLHRWFASKITSKDESQVTTEERQWAKAANFGFPGGLGFARFLDFAANTYGIKDLTEDGAKKLKEQWLDAFPEMRLYLKDSLLERHNFSSLHWSKNPERAAGLFISIIGGQTIAKSSGKKYSPDLRHWAFHTVMKDVSPKHLGATHGSHLFKQAVLRETSITRTGRIRANCTFCQAKNTPFQGLAADGAKVALYKLTVEAEYRVVNFIHDEFIIEVPVNSNFAQVKEDITAIVVGAMKAVVPDVRISTESYFSTCWSKKIEHKVNYEIPDFTKVSVIEQWKRTGPELNADGLI